MAKLEILAGTTSKLVDVFIQDSSSTTGAGLTGLTNGSSGLTWYYYREGAASAVQVTTIDSMTLGTWVTRGFIVIDGTNMPGCYQLGVPDAAVAAGAKSVIMLLKGVTNMAPLVLEIELTATNNQDAVRGGMTALPNAAAEAAGGLYTRGTGAGQVNQPANGMADANVVRNAGTAITAVAGIQEVKVASIAADAVNAAAVAADAGTEIGTAVWATTTRLLTAGTNIVLAKGTGVTGFSDLDAAGVRTAVGLGSANLDTQLDALPTNAELATALGAADDAVLAALSSIDTKIDTIDNLIDTEVGAIKTQTDKLTFGVTNVLNANITHVNETEVTGDGETGTEWGPA